MTIQEAKDILSAPFALSDAVQEAERTILATCEREGTVKFIRSLRSEHRTKALLSVADVALHKASAGNGPTCKVCGTEQT